MRCHPTPSSIAWTQFMSPAPAAGGRRGCAPPVGRCGDHTRSHCPRTNGRSLSHNPGRRLSPIELRLCGSGTVHQRSLVRGSPGLALHNNSRLRTPRLRELRQLSVPIPTRARARLSRVRWPLVSWRASKVGGAGLRCGRSCASSSPRQAVGHGRATDYSLGRARPGSPTITEAESLQAIVGAWWTSCKPWPLRRGQLARAFLNHVDLVPYTLEPIGRTDARQHDRADVQITRARVSGRARLRRYQSQLSAAPR